MHVCIYIYIYWISLLFRYMREVVKGNHSYRTTRKNTDTEQIRKGPKHKKKRKENVQHILSN